VNWLLPLLTVPAFVQKPLPAASVTLSLLLPSTTTWWNLVDALKACAWFLLALGAGGAVAGPLLLLGGVQAQQAAELLRLERPTLAAVLVLTGFAVLIVRTRVKEG
jgi:hypothetical protein